jgi:hypothetical protein
MNRKSRKDVVEAIKSASKSIGEETLTQKKCWDNSDITISDILRYFPKWSDACKAAGVKYDQSRERIPDDDLLFDWGRVTRMLGFIPPLTEYKVKGNYSRNCFDRFGKWVDVPDAFKKYAESNVEWADVLTILDNAALKHKKMKPILKRKTRQVANKKGLHEKLNGRPIYGDPIDFRGLRHEPVNEIGVVFLFGMVAREIGYLVEAIQSGFPDCEAKRKIANGKWQTVQIEFEYESRNFLEHGHDTEKCDVIICWKDNWPECPENLEIVALSKLIDKL